MSEKKLLPDLVEELVNVAYQVEKIKYPATADRRMGWVTAGYIMAYGLEYNYGKNQIRQKLQIEIDQMTKELSDLCDKVEV
jgi:hypothetical protein